MGRSRIVSSSETSLRHRLWRANVRRRENAQARRARGFTIPVAFGAGVAFALGSALARALIAWLS